jgi:hypothetical protein
MDDSIAMLTEFEGWQNVDLDNALYVARECQVIEWEQWPGRLVSLRG